MPVGEDPTTVAVNVTRLPASEGLRSLVSWVTVDNLFTTCSRGELDEDRADGMPRNFAVMECGPAASPLVVKVACPAAFNATEPRTPPTESSNCTEPAVMGTDVRASVTVAVNVTDCPMLDGFTELTSAVTVWLLGIPTAGLAPIPNARATVNPTTTNIHALEILAYESERFIEIPPHWPGHSASPRGCSGPQ